MSTEQERLVYFAKKYLGKKYKFGARISEAPNSFDCSSFIKFLYMKIGIYLPRTALDQASIGYRIESKKSNLKIGDLLFFKGGWGHYNPEYPNGIGYVGIYVGDGKIINARSKKDNGLEVGRVIEEPVTAFIDRLDFTVVRRVL